MNAIPADVAAFLEDRFATIRESCHYRDSYHDAYWRDATKMGQKMGHLLLRNPQLTDETILQILGVLTCGESRGLRLYLMNSNNGREILEHILQIHPKGRDIIFYSYLSYFEGRGYMGSILEGDHIYLWEDQAQKFFRHLLDCEFYSEMEEEAVMRCIFVICHRLSLIPGPEEFGAMLENIQPYASRFYGDIFGGENIHICAISPFWAYYFCTHPQLLTADTLTLIEQRFDLHTLSYFYPTIRNIRPDLLELPIVAEYYERWDTAWDEEIRHIEEEELIPGSDSE